MCMFDIITNLYFRMNLWLLNYYNVIINAVERFSFTIRINCQIHKYTYFQHTFNLRKIYKLSFIINFVIDYLQILFLCGQDALSRGEILQNGRTCRCASWVGE